MATNTRLAAAAGAAWLMQMESCPLAAGEDLPALTKFSSLNQ
jgi:hypothetical protein